MKSGSNFKNVDELSEFFKKMHANRKKDKQGNKRKTLKQEEREIIIAKTGGICHLCGGKIDEKEKWQADHVFPHIHGGTNSLDNFLPAHSRCNRSRWLYSPEEIQLILEIGVWMKTKVEKKNKLALELAEGFVKEKFR